MAHVDQAYPKLVTGLLKRGLGDRAPYVLRNGRRAYSFPMLVILAVVAGILGTLFRDIGTMIEV